MPLISVIIPVYNVEKYLAKCVDSVLSQTFPDIEILLIDDGSTDSSPIICDEYSNKYPFISVIHQENKGLGGARNTGIKNATGKYLFFLDSDDFIHNEALMRCYSIAEKHSCDLVLFDCIAVFEDGSLGAEYPCPFIPENRLIENEDLKAVSFISSACNRLYKAELFTKTDILFPERLWYEDLHTTPKLIPHIKSAFYYHKEPLYFYLQRSGSIMHSPDLNRITTERINAVNSICDYFINNGFVESFKEELRFIRIFHGFFLPVREMQSITRHFEGAADTLRNELLSKVTTPLDNKYLSMLSKKELLLLKWSLKGNYTLIKIFSALNKIIKKVRNVK